MLRDCFEEAFMKNMLMDDGNYDWIVHKKHVIAEQETKRKFDLMNK